MIYKLFNDEARFKQLALDNFSLFEQLQADEDYFADCICFGESNVAFAPIWRKVVGNFESLPAYPGSVAVPHLSIWSNAALMMSDFAHAGLKTALAEYGEFLPIEVDGMPYYIFHLLGSVAVDQQKTEYELSHGAAVGIKKLFFAEDELANKDLFKSFNQGLGGLFCTEHFRDACLSLELDGLIFEINGGGKPAGVPSTG